jgi:AcrR family transcriptional regulator
VRATPAVNRGGRPLDATRDLALRKAALELLAEVGYDRMTMDAIAARASAAKTTIYRRWPSKADLVVDAIDTLNGDHEIADTGSLRTDLHAMALDITGTQNHMVAMTVGMVTALAHDAELRRVFRERFIAPRMAEFRSIFERAIERGEMAPGHDLGLLARLFPALCLQQLVITGELPDATSACGLMDDVVHTLATGARTTHTSSKGTPDE